MKITNYSITNYASKDVASAPDILTGTVAENKAVFDKLSKEVIVPAFNNLAAAVAGASVIGGLGTDSIINDLSGLYHITANLVIKNASQMASVTLTRGDLINVFAMNETSFSLVRISPDGTIKIYTFGSISITLVSEFAAKAYVDSNISANLTQANSYTDSKIAIAKSEAKTYTDEEITELNTAVSAAIAAVHSHNNKAVLDTVTSNSILRTVSAGESSIADLSGLYMCNAITYYNIRPSAVSAGTLGLLINASEIFYVYGDYVFVISPSGETINLYTFTSTAYTLTKEFTTKAYVDGEISTVTGLANDAQTTANSAVNGVQAINADKGVGIATLDTNGKVFISQIPATAIHDILEISSESELTGLTAQKSDAAYIIEIINSVRTITKGYQLLGDGDPTKLENWVLMGSSYAVQALFAASAATAENALKINGYDFIKMTQAEYDAAVIDTSAFYMVG